MNTLDKYEKHLKSEKTRTKPFIELILTFKKEQEFITLDILPFSDKLKMIGFCLGVAAILDKGNLVKVSMCIYTGDTPMNEVKTPKWYNECNGKIWQHELVLE